MMLESHDGSITGTDVALLVAVGEPRCDTASSETRRLRPTGTRRRPHRLACRQSSPPWVRMELLACAYYPRSGGLAWNIPARAQELENGRAPLIAANDFPVDQAG